MAWFSGTGLLTGLKLFTVYSYGPLTFVLLSLALDELFVFCVCLSCGTVYVLLNLSVQWNCVVWSGGTGYVFVL